MALQVNKALAGNIAQLARWDRKQALFAGEKPLDCIKPGAVAPMDRHPLVPIAPIGGKEFIAWHNPPISSILDRDRRTSGMIPDFRHDHRGERRAWT